MMGIGLGSVCSGVHISCFGPVEISRCSWSPRHEGLLIPERLRKYLHMQEATNTMPNEAMLWINSTLIANGLASLRRWLAKLRR